MQRAVIRDAIFALAASSLLVAGCTHQGRLVQVQPLETNLSSYRTALVRVESDVFGADGEARTVETMVGTALSERGLFSDVELASASPDARGDLTVLIRITRLKRISPADRRQGGALLGRASIAAEVQLLAAPNGLRVGAFEAVGESAAGSILSLGQGDTSHAIRELVEKIMEGIDAKSA